MNDHDPRLKLWSLILIVGSGLLFVAFFLPWWSMTVTYPELPESPGRMASADDFKQYRDDIEKHGKDVDKLMKGLKKNRKWYDNKIPSSKWDRFEDDMSEGRKDKKKFSATVRLWGWNTGVGLTNFIFSFILLPVGIVPMFVKLLRRWIWTGYFAAGIMGLVGFILSLVWYFSSPGENVSGLLSQGVGMSPGPYLNILGTLAVTAAGILGGVFGLLYFLKSLKGGTRPAAAATMPIEQMDEDFDE